MREAPYNRRVEDTMPPTAPRSARQSGQFVPQMMTFDIKQCDGGAERFDEWVNSFVERSARETGMTPILKPHATGCVVIYWKKVEQPEGEAPTGPVEGTKKSWWPPRMDNPPPPPPERTTVVSVITERLT